MAKLNRKIGVIGLGRMGRCLLQGLIGSGVLKAEDVIFTTKHEETGERLSLELGIARAKNNRALVAETETVILAVKPQNAAEVISDCSSAFTSEHTLISIVASVSTGQLEQNLPKGTAVVRAMPNTPAFVGQGMTAIAPGKYAADRDWSRAVTVFKPVGKYLRVDEKHMDAVTGLSGCGPAYIYVVLESLTDAGIKVGLPRELARELATQTVLGAATMLQQTGLHPAALKDEVTTPAGCTIDGLLELEEGKLRVTLMKAVVQATERAKVLAKQGPI